MMMATSGATMMKATVMTITMSRMMAERIAMMMLAAMHDRGARDFDTSLTRQRCREQPGQRYVEVEVDKLTMVPIAMGKGQRGTRDFDNSLPRLLRHQQPGQIFVEVIGALPF